MMNGILGQAKRRYLFLAGIVIGAAFFCTRFFTILGFPIFNDEGIYLQYSQIIAQDFSKYKFVSVNNIYRDFKPPLQYWLGSIFVPLIKNPLLAGRLLSALFSLLGLTGVYLVASLLWDRRTALLTALAYVFHPLILFYSIEFVAEVYVFSSAVIFLYFLLKILKMSRKPSLWLFVGGVVSGTALLLFKQAGLLYFYLYLGLPLFFLPDKIKRPIAPGDLSKKERNLIIQQRRYFIRNVFIFLGALCFAFILYRFFIIPPELLKIDSQFAGRWTLSLQEILKVPFPIWLANLKMVYDLYSSYYGLSLFGLIGIFLLYAFYFQKKGDLLIGYLFIAGSLMVIFCLRGFNEYVYNTAVVIFMILILGRLASWALFERLVADKKTLMIPVLKDLTTFLLAATIIFWSYQIILMKSAPIDYVLRSTDWARGNYLWGWSSGFGVDDVVKIFENQKEPAVAFIDPQWGNPGTALQVFEGFYPQVKLFPAPFLLDPTFINQTELSIYKKKFIVFSQNGNVQELRNEWQMPIERKFCGIKKEIKKHPLQTPIIVCEF